MGFGEIPEMSVVPSGATSLQDQFRMEEMNSGGGGGGSDDRKKAPQLTLLPPPAPFLGRPVSGAMLATSVIVGPVLLPASDYSSKSSGMAEEDDDPELNDPELGGGDMDDPESDSVTRDEPGGRGATPAFALATAAAPPPERDAPGGRGETLLTVVVGIISPLSFPGATASTAVATNVTVQAGTTTPQFTPAPDRDVCDDPAVPAAVPARWADAPARADLLSITDQLAEVHLAWPVHDPPLAAAFLGAGNPVPMTDQLGKLCLDWPVHNPLLEVIVLAAVSPLCYRQESCRPRPSRRGRGPGGPGRAGRRLWVV
jgi:hypothetical protein